MHKLLKILLAGLVCLGSMAPAFADESAGVLPCTLTAENGTPVWQLSDQNRSTKLDWSGGTLTVESTEPITGLYLIWDRPPESWTGTAGSQSLSGGEYGFLHEYLPLESPVTRAELTLPEGSRCCDVYAFGAGELPDWVQQWQPPLADADLLVLPTHADDEHLFFGGTMPYYAGELGKKVQVVYFTNHWAEPYRPHELLDGLWTVGIRNYPVMSSFVDQYADSLDYARTLYDEEEAVTWQVQQLRRFKPEVVVGHDVNGEYGHGVHMYNADTLMKALELSADPSYDGAYGTCPRPICTSGRKIPLSWTGASPSPPLEAKPLWRWHGWALRNMCPSRPSSRWRTTAPMTAGNSGSIARWWAWMPRAGISLRISQPRTTRTISRPSRSRNRNRSLCPNRSRSAPGPCRAGYFWREW